MKKSIRIGERVYPTKTRAAEAIRAVLYAYPVGASVHDEHAQFLADLILLHPEAAAKIGCGIASFQVEQNLGSRGFWLTRVDGSRTDFSFLACLTPPSKEAEALAGLRSEVRAQIFAFRDGAFARRDTIACEVTGDPVTRATAHVDHAKPFETLVRAFLDLKNLELGSVEVEPTRDGETDTRLLDRNLAAAWRSFHLYRAELRIVSARANLSLLRRNGSR